MAIFIHGMKCPLCGLPMADSTEVLGFPAFIANKKDPLHLFSDGVFHKRCIEAHPLGDALVCRYEAWRAANRPPARICKVSGVLITDPDDYIGLGFLVSSPTHELYPFNWAHFSRRAFNEWPQRGALIAAIERLPECGVWDEDGVRQILGELARPVF